MSNFNHLIDPDELFLTEEQLYDLAASAVQIEDGKIHNQVDCWVEDGGGCLLWQYDPARVGAIGIDHDMDGRGVTYHVSKEGRRYRVFREGKK